MNANSLHDIFKSLLSKYQSSEYLNDRKIALDIKFYRQYQHFKPGYLGKALVFLYEKEDGFYLWYIGTFKRISDSRARALLDDITGDHHSTNPVKRNEGGWGDEDIIVYETKATWTVNMYHDQFEEYFFKDLDD